MSITIELPEDLMNALTQQATEEGLPLAEYIQRMLALRGAAEKLPSSGAELLAYWQHHGLIGCRPDIADGQQRARELREQAQRRTRG